MRWSDNFLIPTLKESPSEAESLSHKLMIRAGLIRKLSSGIYSYLPLGQRILSKTIKIIRKHMNLSGAQEVLLPALQPASLWENSGRLKLLGDDIFSFRDRHKNLMVLGPTHEEVITSLVNNEIKSYKQLPQILYQIQTKFRDEPRPRFGVIRSKEFIMKDAYSFDRDEEGLNRSYELMKKTYINILSECGLEFVIVEADPGFMGGKQSSEFMILSDSGEDLIVTCGCGVAFSLDAAPCLNVEVSKKKVKQLPLKEISTPAKTTIEEVSQFLRVAPNNLVKTIIYKIEGQQPLAILIRGDHRVNEAKLRKFLGTDRLSLADEKTVFLVTNSKIGYSGPVGLKGIRIIADYAVREMTNFVCGANKDDTHLINVNEPRDFKIDEFADLRFVENEDVCPKCQEKKLKLKRAIELGHIFKLGTRYSEALGATYLDADQREKPIIMGCYGLGINRIIAACIEQNHDDKGICWPLSLSPFDMVMIVLNPSDKNVLSVSENIYKKLNKADMDVLLDKRDRKAGVKFKDADLIGFYLRLVISLRTLSKGVVEISLRKGEKAKYVKIEEIKQETKKLLDKG
jgi:prolyl-tRNA synthetase